MSAPTPGPWHLDSVNRIRAAQGVHIGEVASSWTHGYMNPAETVANGKLMAASPVLLAAVRAARNFVADIESTEARSLRKLLDLALSTAGDQS